MLKFNYSILKPLIDYNRIYSRDELPLKKIALNNGKTYNTRRVDFNEKPESGDMYFCLSYKGLSHIFLIENDTISSHNSNEKIYGGLKEFNNYFVTRIIHKKRIG